MMQGMDMVGWRNGGVGRGGIYKEKVQITPLKFGIYPDYPLNLQLVQFTPTISVSLIYPLT